MSGAYPDSGEMHRAAWVGAGHHVISNPGDRCNLALPDLGRKHRLQRRVGAARTTAQPVVVKLDHVGHTSEYRSHGKMRSLHVTEMAWVLNDHGSNLSLWCEQVDTFGHELMDVEHPVGKRRRLGGPQQAPVFLHRRAAPCRVHEDRLVTGHRCHHRDCQRLRFVVETGMHVQRSTASTAPTRQRKGDIDRCQNLRCGDVHVTLPRIHHTAGVQPDVATG